LTPTFAIYSSTESLPKKWNVIAASTIFLQINYLKVLENSAPKNMTFHFIGVFKNQELVGVALSQFIDLNKVSSYGERDSNIKTAARKFVFKNFCSHVLFIGNNMLTGQNAFAYSNAISSTEMMQALVQVAKTLEKQFKTKGTKVHLTVFKDFESDEAANLSKVLPDYYQFSTQPNMVFDIPKEWETEDDYIKALSKKYRDQFKRARKKQVEIHKRKLSLEEIQQRRNEIYSLYETVAQNAPFNTFMLTENHFETLKENLKDNFLFYGYFLNEKLIGFNTLIKNGTAMDTYFLGYDLSIQKEKMLYLNMLYDMVAYSIKKQFETIVFARTALEIKSSVGAKPVAMKGFIKHHFFAVNKCIGTIFKYLEPKTEWQERNPFKD
jgi:predicted N-acyltransferase